MAETVTYALAQAEADAAGAGVRPAGEAGIVPLEHAGQVLRGDSDAGIADDQGGGLLQSYGNGALRGVLERVGKHLLHDEGEPFRIREDFGADRLIFQLQEKFAQLQEKK